MTSSTPSAAMACETFVYGESSTIGARWETWLERFELYITATGLTDAVKTKACFLVHVGSDVYSIFKTLRKADNSDTYLEAHTKLTKHFVTTRSQFAEDQTFRRATKRSEETVDEFIMRLRQLAMYCKYADIDAEILAHFVAHCNMEQFQIKALREDTLTLSKAIALAKGYERDSSSLSQLKHKTYNDNGINFAGKQMDQNQSMKRNPGYVNKEPFINQNYNCRQQSSSQCKYCGKQGHQIKQECPAYAMQCRKCGKRNHFANMCMSQSQPQRGNLHSSQQYQTQHQQNYGNSNSRERFQHKPMATNNYGKTNFKSGYNIQASVNDQQRGNNENLEQNKTQHCTRDESNRMTNNAIMEQLGQLESYQFAILADNNSANAINSIDVVPQLELKLGNNTITMVIDTGAAVNMIDDATFQNLSEQPELEICNRQYYAYGEDKAIKIVGQFVCEISYRSKTIKAAFLVANDGHQNLLSYRTSVQLGIVNIINKIEESQIVGLYKKYPNIFSGKLGKLKDEVFEIITDPSIKPTQQKLRKVPRQLQEEVTKELVEMEKEGIIERVRWPTSWVSNIVAVPKSGTPLKVRITCDMRGLNKAIKRIKYPITTIDDVIYKANGAKWFSKLDMRKAYQNYFQFDMNYLAGMAFHNFSSIECSIDNLKDIKIILYLQYLFIWFIDLIILKDILPRKCNLILKNDKCLIEEVVNNENENIHPVIKQNWNQAEFQYFHSHIAKVSMSVNYSNLKFKSYLTQI
jgi:hypothetical protein